jgi:hypothetical protein
MKNISLRLFIHISQCVMYTDNTSVNEHYFFSIRIYNFGNLFGNTVFTMKFGNEQ